jgi:hypothetical protein
MRVNKRKEKRKRNRWQGKDGPGAGGERKFRRERKNHHGDHNFTNTVRGSLQTILIDRSTLDQKRKQKKCAETYEP